MKSLFESVSFLNKDNGSDSFIEGVLVEDAEILNEAVMLKYIKKEDVPESFKKEAIKICELIQEESGGVKGVEGILPHSIHAGFGIKLNNALKKIKNGGKKNRYTIRFPYKAARRATSTEKKGLDLFVRNLKLVNDYCISVCKKLGYKKLSNKVGSADTMFKKVNGCIYSIQIIPDTNAAVVLLLGCLEDTKDNRDLLSGNF